MSIENSLNSRLNQTVPQGHDLRGQEAIRRGNAGSSASVEGGGGPGAVGPSQFQSALAQSLGQAAGGGLTTRQELSSSSSGTGSTVPDQALASFVQNLFAALGGPSPNTAGEVAAERDPGLTRDALASSLAEAQTSDSNRYDRNLALLNNFDTADTNGDGAISRDEAHAFNEANSIPTIENGTRVPPDQAYRPEFGTQMAANLESLIQQLADASATTTDGAAAAAGSDTSHSLLNSLELSYSDLMAAMGGNAGSGSLASFLESLKSSLSALGPTGNVVNTSA